MFSQFNRKTLYAPVFLLIGLVFAYRPILFSGFSFMQADPGDTRLNQYILEHGFQWVSGNPAHANFWNAPYFFPETNVTAYTDVLLGSAPIYWFFRFLRFASDTSFQLWLIFLSVLNYGAAYFFLRREFRFDQLPGSIGAFLFAFSSARISQLGHAQLLAQFWSVLAVWAVFRALKAGSKNSFFLYVAFACLVLQFYSSFYLGWFLAFGTYVTVVCCLALPSLRPVTVAFFLKHWKALFVGGLLAGFALAPMGYHYVIAGKLLGARSFEEVESYAPRIHSWIYLGDLSWLYRWEQFIGLFDRLYAQHEQRLGLGFVTLFLALSALVRRRGEKQFYVLLLVSVTIVVLTTKVFPHGGQLWYVFGYKGFPGGIGIRSLSRVILLLLLPAMIGLSAFFQSYRGRWMLMLVAIVVLEQGQSLEYFDKTLNRKIIQSISSEVPSGCSSFYLPTKTSGSMAELDGYQVDAMWASMETGIPTLNGYSGNKPPKWNLVLGEPYLERWLDYKTYPKREVCMVRANPQAVATQLYY
jgi:hypothetical protein